MADDVDLIELIDVDPGAFGPGVSARPVASPEATAPAEGRGAAFWARVGMAASVASMVALAAGAFVVRPWEQDARLHFSDPAPEVPALGDHLLFDPAPAELRSTSMGGLRNPTGIRLQDDAVGYLWGESGISMLAGDDARWFGFYAVPAGGPDAFEISAQRTIAGVPAEADDQQGGTAVRLAWGPLDGLLYTAFASRSSVDQAVAIAEQLRVKDDRITVLRPEVLADLQPLGSFGDYRRLLLLDQFAADFDQKVPGYTGLYYGFSGQSVGSMAGNERALDMVGRMLTDTPREGTVHGRRAVGFTAGQGPFGAPDRSAVIWWEGGRLIYVQGDGDLAATFALAETVRPATDAEWADIEAIDR